MLVSTMCSWCHSMNLVTDQSCRTCGHDAHVARWLCGCPQCQCLIPVPPPSPAAPEEQAKRTLPPHLTERGGNHHGR